MIRASLIVAATIALAACSGGQRPRIPDQIIERSIKGAPGEAQPSRIVATESAFARMAREEGQWTAFRAFAAPGAMIHGRNGAIPAEPWLAAQSDPAEAVQWGPREVWMSCDAKLAVSTGRFRDPEGIVGNFITVWQRQPDGGYRWVYDSGTPDDPQPPPRAAPEEGDIVVTAMDSVRGHVADCGSKKEDRPSLPLESTSGVSPDGTLAYRWEHVGGGDRIFTAYWLRGGVWEKAMDELWPASGAD